MSSLTRTSVLGALVAVACGPPTVDVRVLTPLPRAARAPAAEAERGVISAERALAHAHDAFAKAQADVVDAQTVVGRAPVGHPKAAFAQTDLAYQRQLAGKRSLQVVLSERALALAEARYELAKATVVDENSLPEAVDLTIEDFREAVEEAAVDVAETQREVDAQSVRLAILKKAVHAARVASLRAQ